jgi:hypothetical protein
MPLTAKERILKERGLSQKQPAPRKHRRFQAEIKAKVSGKPKTSLMKYLEQKYKVAIEEVLVSGSLSVVAKKLGNEVDTTTLSRWIKRFKLRYSGDNLPSCDGCKHYGPACDSGICYILADMELYDLIPIKKQEVLNDS